MTMRRILLILFLMVITVRTKGQEQDLSDNAGINDVPSRSGRHERSFKSFLMPAKRKSDNKTVLERFESIQSKMKEGVNYAIKELMPYMMQNSSGMNISSQCMKDSMFLISGLKRLRPWAIQFLDSSAKMIDGMLEGTLSALGTYDECLSIEALSEKSKEKGKVLFVGQYCAVDISFPMPTKTRYFTRGKILPELQNFSERGTVLDFVAENAEFLHFVSFRYGLCVPSGCSVEDLSQVVTKLVNLIDLDASVSRCEIKEERKFTPIQITIICMFCFIGLLVVIATSMSTYAYYKKTEFKSTSVRILLCFDLKANFLKFINTDTTSDVLGALSGIRFITMTWIVLGHTYMSLSYHSFGGMKNALDHSKDFTFQAIANSYVTVDTFYCIGGLLVCYSTMKMLKVEKRSLSVPMHIIYRLWRIMPIYIFAIFIFLFGTHLGSGPVWYDTINEHVQNCYDNWWTNLIFINNFYNSLHMCIPQSWYIASDFQLYVAALLILIPMSKSPRVGLALCVIATITCIIYTGIGTVVFNLPYALLATKPDPLEMFDYLVKFYYRPFVHVGAYCIGMMSGYLLAAQPNLKIPPKYQVIGWCLAFTSCFSVLYGIYEWQNGREPSVVEGLIYTCLFRPAWTSGVAWMIVCCSTGHGGIINYILTWKLFIPLSRLTYIVYLIHPVVQVTFIGNMRTLWKTDHLTVMYLFFGHLCTSYMVAFGLSMLIESPSLTLQKLILGLGKKKKSATNTERKNSILNGNLGTNKHGDLAMIVQDTYKELQGIDNEAAAYKL